MKPAATFFLLSAAALATYGVAEALGLRDLVSVLSGTPVPGIPFEEAALGAAVYLVSYFGAVLLAPILAIAGALSALSRVWLDRVAATRDGFSAICGE